MARKNPVKRSNVKKAFDEVKEKTETGKLVDEALAGTNADAVLSASKDVAPEKIADTLTKAQLGISSALDSVKSQVFAHLNQLEVLRSAVEQQKALLEDSYDKEVVMLSTSELFERYNEKERLLEDTYAAKLDALKARAAEAEEVSAKRVMSAAAAHKRSAEELAYQASIEERDAEDRREQKQREWELQWDDKKRAAERDLDARIEAVKKREIDAVVAIEKADAMAAKLDADVDKARKQGASAAYAEMNVKMNLAAAQAEKTAAVHIATIDNLRSKVEELYISKEAAEKAAERAQQRVETIATAAMEAQSGKAALKAAQDMAERTSGKDKGR